MLVGNKDTDANSIKNKNKKSNISVKIEEDTNTEAKPKKINETRDSKNKFDVPVLKQPAETRYGKFLIWLLMFVMCFAIVAGIAYAIYQGFANGSIRF